MEAEVRGFGRKEEMKERPGWKRGQKEERGKMFRYKVGETGLSPECQQKE